MPQSDQSGDNTGDVAVPRVMLTLGMSFYLCLLCRAGGVGGIVPNMLHEFVIVRVAHGACAIWEQKPLSL